VETPIDPIEGIRAIATCGLSTTETVGYSFTALQKAAVAALDRAGTAGPGSIVTGVAAL